MAHLCHGEQDHGHVQGRDSVRPCSTGRSMRAQLGGIALTPASLNGETYTVIIFFSPLRLLSYPDRADFLKKRAQKVRFPSGRTQRPCSKMPSLQDSFRKTSRRAKRVKVVVCFPTAEVLKKKVGPIRLIVK